MATKLSVKEYLAQTNLNALVDEALNDLYKSQSTDPSAFLAQWFASKTKNATAIEKIVAREILDSRGNPTVECDVIVAGRVVARASAPSGASTGSNEAKELRDGDKKRYLGKGVLVAVRNVNEKLAPALVGADAANLRACDDIACRTDGTELKEVIGGNAITAASFAIAEAGAHLRNKELFLHFADTFFGADANPARFSLPTPLVNIVNGGKHAGGKLKIQEFMIVPRRDIPFSEALRYVTEVYHHLGKILAARYGVSAKNLGDEGGYAPSLQSPGEALDCIETAIREAGYTVGTDIRLALDCAASEFYNEETKQYEVEEGMFLTSDELVEYYSKLIDAHPALYSIEDGFHEHDYEGFKKMTERLSSRVMIVGDDLYTTNTRLIRRGIAEKWATALLLKVNQIGTISEAMDAAKMKFDAGMNVIVSHRSGETSTSVISDLVVGIGAGFIKTGAPARGERVAKYNRLLEIEEFLRAQDRLEIRKSAW